MAYKKKTWQEKLEDPKDMPKVLDFDPKFPCGRSLEKVGAQPGDRVVLVPPMEVNELIKEVPEGMVTTLNEICEALAKKHDADYCCTLTTGIFVMIAANAAVEMATKVPYWRTIKNNGGLNAKFPGGMEQHKKLLAKEGHQFKKRGRKYIRYMVADFEESLFTWN